MAGAGTSGDSVLVLGALDVCDAGLGLRLNLRAAGGSVSLGESGFARLALGLRGAGTGDGSVLARRARGVGDALVRARATCRVGVLNQIGQPVKPTNQ